MFGELREINERPKPFEKYSAADLWADEHRSAQMLAYHLDGVSDLSSRNAEFIARSVQWISSRFELGPDKGLMDFGCGPGLYTNRLARTGARVIGIDFSARSLQHAREQAREQGLGVEYVQGNYLEYEGEQQLDLITMIMCDFCALSPEQRRTMLDRFQALLKPGGSVLLDVYSLSAFGAREEITTYAENSLNGFWSAEPYFGFMNTFKYETDKVVLDKYTIVEAKGSSVVYNWLQYFDSESLTAEFQAAGFSEHELLGDVAGAEFDAQAPEFAILAYKPV